MRRCRHRYSRRRRHHRRFEDSDDMLEPWMIGGEATKPAP
jgi:hypothetical protein